MVDIFWHNKTLLAQAMEYCGNPSQKVLEKVKILKEKDKYLGENNMGDSICYRRYIDIGQKDVV